MAEQQETLSLELFREVLPIGQEYSYKKMCNLLGQKYYSGGKSKQLQLKDWERFVDMEKIGTKYKIIRIKEVPDKKIDGRGKSEGSRRNNNPNGDLFDTLIKTSSCVTGGAVNTSFGRLLTDEITLYSPILIDLYSDRKINDLSFKLQIDASMIKDYVSTVKQYTKDQIKKSLNRLEEDGVLNHEIYYSIKSSYDEAVMLTPMDSKIIIDIETEICQEMGYKDRRGKKWIYQNRAKTAEFKTKVLTKVNTNKIIKSYSQNEITSYWECVSYEFNDEYVGEFDEDEYKQALVNVTHAIIETMHHKIEKVTRSVVNREGFGDKKDKYITVLKYDSDKDRINTITLDSTFFTHWDSSWVDKKNEKYTRLMIANTRANTQREIIFDFNVEATTDILFTPQELNTIPFLRW